LATWKRENVKGHNRKEGEEKRGEGRGRSML
jgi:hypothetical protein